ncbi:MAG: DUF1840 domain-containing protein [Lysobacterales bacterium]
MIKFSCSATGDVQMLQAHAEMLLQAIGKELGERGVITPAEMPAAIAALTAAGERDRHQRADEESDSNDGDDEGKDVNANQVGLSQRAFPLVEMLKRALEADKPVVWGL